MPAILNRTSPPTHATRCIELRGVRVHNLQAIDLDIPLGQLVVLSGVSGSGKSSLAFDTLFAEGQRRYIESFSATARQYLERIERPNADRIAHVPPAIAIRSDIRRARSSSPTNVAALTEIDESLRRLFARIGRVICPACNLDVRSHSAEDVVRAASTLADGTRFQLCFPADEESAEERSTWQARGFTRAIRDERSLTVEELCLTPASTRRFSKDGLGEPGGVSPRTPLAKNPGADATRLTKNEAREAAGSRRGNGLNADDENARYGADHAVDQDEVWLVADRLVAGKVTVERLTESAETALREGAGRCLLLVAQHESASGPLRGVTAGVGEGFAHPIVGWAVPTTVADELVGTAHPTSCETPYLVAKAVTESRVIEGLAWSVQRFSRRWDCGGCQREFLPPDPRLFLVDGAGGCEVCRERDASSARCSTCLDSRLRGEALAVRVAGSNFADMLALTARAAAARLEWIETQLDEGERARTVLIRADLTERLRLVCDLGLDHLTLNRSAATLSGGVTRRLLLAAALGSRVTGTLCVIDEPSAGLHPDELPLVIRALRQLQALRNSLIVVDHAPEIVLAADHVIDLGPGAGPAGGSVVFAGTPSELSLIQASVTGRVLRERAALNERTSAVPANPSPRTPADWLTLTNVRHRHWGEVASAGSVPDAQSVRDTLPTHGAKGDTATAIDPPILSGQTLRVPLNVLCVVTGRGGSGKTSLIVETLVPAVCRRLGQACAVTFPGECDSLTGGDTLVEVALVDQSPLTRSSRSNAATWIDVFDEIREVFALTGEAKQRGFGPQHFSFNAAQGGRCRACRGTGTLRHDMQFLADVSLTCPECAGTRYRREILEVKYRGRTIADVLAMSAAEAATFFRNHPKLQGRLHLLKQMGLDYVVLGQPTDTLSGGEAQRLKLASRLTTSRGPTLIVCDEPTVGLHPADVSRLLACFHELLAIGHSVVVIDNSPELRQAADHLIDLSKSGFS